MPYSLRPLRCAVLGALLAASCVHAQPCAPYIEEQGLEGAATLRAPTHALVHCEVDQVAYQRVVAQWLRSRSAAAPALRSLALGRAVSYPWISQHLTEAAARDAQWRALAARTPRAGRDRLVAPLLEQRDLLDRLSAPFAGSRYELAGVSFEKVLWNEAGLPFDAQLWLQLDLRC